MEQTLQLAEERRRRFEPQRTIDLYQYWSSTRDYGRKFSSFGEGVATSRLSIPSRTGDRSMLRIGFEASLNAPNESGGTSRKVVRFTDDFAVGKTVGEIREELRARALAWLQRFYDVRQDTLAKRSVGIKVTSMEAL